MRERQRAATPLGTGGRRGPRDGRRREARKTGAFTRVALLRVVAVVEKTPTSISMMSNDATVEAGMAKANCGASMMGAGASVIAMDAAVISGAIQMGTNATKLAVTGPSLPTRMPLVTVARWGRPGLQAGDWVMKGEANYMNYILSGKFDPGPWNQFASFASGQEFQVAATSLYWPSGWEFFKGILGQRIYWP
jgi:hypothetical protein